MDASYRRIKRTMKNSLQKVSSSIKKSIRKPKTYEDYKREMRENRKEIELTGSNKAYWRNLAKLIGKEKAERRRRNAIDQRGKIRCADKGGNVVEIEKTRS